MQYSIQGLSSAVLSTAKTLTRFKNILHVVTFICVALSIFITGKWLYLIALVALLSEFGSWIFKILASNKKSLGQELLRLNIIQKSFNSEMPIDTAYLKRQISDSEYEKSTDFDKENYYATTNKEPDKKIIDIIQESCFWSQHLYQVCKSRSILISIILSLLIVIFTISSIALIEADSSYSLPRLSLLFFMFFPLWNEVENAIKYGEAHNKLSQIDYRLSLMSYNIPAILSIFSDYNVITSNTPLIPQSVYKKESKKLNNLWIERNAEK